MGRPSKIEMLPADVKAGLRVEIKRRRFSGYREIEEILREQGHDVDHVAIWRYAQAMKQDEHVVELALDFAEMMQDRLGGDAVDAMSQSNIYMIQALIHQQLSALIEAAQAGESDPEALARMAESLSKLVRSSLAQKKHSAEIQAKLNQAADKTADLAREQGLSEDAVCEIRSKILGIA